MIENITNKFTKEDNVLTVDFSNFTTNQLNWLNSLTPDEIKKLQNTTVTFDLDVVYLKRGLIDINTIHTPILFGRVIIPSHIKSIPWDFFKTNCQAVTEIINRSKHINLNDLYLKNINLIK